MSKFIAAGFLALYICCVAQAATPPAIEDARGFLDICGLKDKLSKENMAEPTIEKALAAKQADDSLCLGYLTGLIDGWKEGHEHGVVAAHFTAGFPQDEFAAFKAMPEKERQDMGVAFKVDVPCLPDKVTLGELRDIVVKWIQDSKDPLLSELRTSRAVELALRAAFPCTSPKAASPVVQKHTYAELQPLLDNRCFRSKTADEQKKLLQRIDEAPDADFKKTIDDLNAINAADRLLGTQGCEDPK
jgi:Ssp1 endopeptidase immunity protein Rap1a